MKRARWTVGGAVALFLVGGAALLAASGSPAGSKAIAVEDLEAHVAWLSSDDLAGRDTGEGGIGRAEEYIAASFAASGLKPLPGESDFYLDFTLYRDSYDVAATTLEIRSGERTRSGRAGVDLRPFDFSDDGSVEAPVVFAGYGITSDDHDWDDYAGLDVEGKIVLVLRHEPGEKDPQGSFDGTSSTDHATFARKARNAKDHGALGMILVTDPLNHAPGDDLRLGGALRLKPGDEGRPSRASAGGDDREEPPFLAVHVSRDLAAALVAPAEAAGSGLDTLERMQREVDAGRTPSELPLGPVTARLSVARRDEPQQVAARNVAAFLEGSDPELRHEWIVVGGHHDHIGAFRGPGDTVYNGADDNASGTAGVLELAQAFASREQRPKRSLVFTTFSAEERGLLGSKALVIEPLLPMERVVFMLNLDMIGRNPDRPLQVFGDGYVRGLRELVQKANRGPRRDLEFGGTDYSGNSDHDSFYRRDVPFMFFFTGTHDDYHQLGDHAEKLDYRNMLAVLRLAYGVLDRLADAEQKPTFIHQLDWLGASIEVTGVGDDRAARVTGVDEGSRAAEFGLRVGDALVAFGERRLDRPDDVGARFREIEPGEEVALEVARAEGSRTLTIRRAKVGYMGVFPGRLDEDLRRELGLNDDQGVLLRQVVPDGPCGKAGLQEGDVVARIDGIPIGPGSLRSRLSQIGAGETVTMHVLRDGKPLEIAVTLGERPQRRP